MKDLEFLPAVMGMKITKQVLLHEFGESKFQILHIFSFKIYPIFTNYVTFQNSELKYYMGQKAI